MPQLNTPNSGIRVDDARLRQLRKAIQTLPSAVAKRRVLVGFTRALKVTRDAAKMSVPTSSGALKKSLHVVRGRQATETSPYVVLRINPKTSVSYTNESGVGVTREPRTYYHILAYGTKGGVKTTKKTGFTFRAYDEDGRPLRVKKITQPSLGGEDYIGDAWKATRARVQNEALGFIYNAVQEHKRKNGLE